ncbi:MAG: HAD-IA family hydrolase [bacterium]|nr:HAD-IA family hydrolase [bacterium]
MQRKLKPEIKAIFFDVGGVIISGICANTIIQIKKEFGRWMTVPRLRVVRRHLRLATRGTCTVPKAVGNISKALRLAPAGRRTLQCILSSKWYEQNSRINRNVLALARRLARRYIVGIISDTIPSHTRINARWGIYKHFSPVVLSHRTQAYKPEAKIFRYALRKAGVLAPEVIFIDDRSDKLSGAVKLGMHGIIFKNATKLKHDLIKLGVLWK